MTTRGLSFVALEGTERLLDWGIHRQAETEAQLRRCVDDFVNRYDPEVLVLEEPADSNKGQRARSAVSTLEHLGRVAGLQTVSIAWTLLDRRDAAERIALRFPALRVALPEISRYSAAKSPTYDVFVAAARGLHVLSILQSPADPAHGAETAS